MAHRSHTQLIRRTRRVPQHAVGTKGGPASRAIPRPLGSARLGSRKRIKLVRSTRGPQRPPLDSIHLTRPVEHGFERHGADPLFLAVFRACQVRPRRRVARPSLSGNTSAGSRSCRHPPRGTKTSGLSSRRSRTPARTLPPARTLLPPVSASPSPGRPTQSRPLPDVDSHATPAAFLGDFARPPRARHVASSPCQEITASTAARRSAPS